MAKRIEERHALPASKVDRTGVFPLILNVPLCGPVSANRRRYRVEAFAGDRIKRYENVKGYMNHGSPREARRWEDHLFTVTNPRHNAAGYPVGDLKVFPKHPYAERFLEAAEHDPKSCGMSHVANCETVTSPDGWEEITEVVEVVSVDLVTDPATTKGFHEGKSVSRISLNQFAERFGPKWGAHRWAAVTKLCEELGDMVDAPVMDEPPPDAGEGDLKAALMAALDPFMHDAFDSGDSDKLCAACRDFVKMHAKHTGQKPADKSDDEPADDDEGEDMPKESRPQPWDVLRECQEAGYAASAAELELLSLQPDAAKRKTFVSEQKAKLANAKAEKPVSAARRPGADVKTEQQTESRVTWAD